METLQSAQSTSQARRGTLIKFNPSDRWAISGKTGTGKTVFMHWWETHWYAAGWPIVIIDIKRKYTSFVERGEYAKEPELATLDKPYNITATGQLIPGCMVAIYHPSIPGWQDTKLDRLLLQVLATGNTVLIIDEIRGVADEHHSPLGLVLVLTQGRQSNIPTITGFQKPVSIPTDLLEQSEWYVVFRQKNPEYREKLVKLSGFPELIQPPPLYYYWLAYENWEEPVLMAPVPLLPEARVPRGPEIVGASGRGLQHTALAGSGQKRR